MARKVATATKTDKNDVQVFSPTDPGSAVNKGRVQYRNYGLPAVCLC